MRKSLSTLLTWYARIKYIRSCNQLQKLCLTQTQSSHTTKSCLKANGRQEKPFSSVFQSPLEILLWRSLESSTAIQKLRIKFSNLLSLLLLSSPQNKISPNRLHLFGEVLPLVKVKVGAIQMVSNDVKLVNRTDLPLHILGGV